MSEQQPTETEHVCFSLPAGFSGVMPATELLNSAVPNKAGNHMIWASDSDDLLCGFSSRGLEVMSRFVPTLMCGEESATHVFHREAKRVEDLRAAKRSSALMAEIATEEAFHERLLSLLRARLPVPDDLDMLRGRARFFFLRLASRDPATHFSRIVGLDGGVCITLNSLLQPSSALAKAPAAFRIWDRIWRDEARHVRISRQHVLDLGIERARLLEEGARARKGLAELLLPLADDFEDMGVDPDKLLRRITGPEEV